MFNIKNYANNLQYSQRFYYSNYEFYNDYDKAEDFPNDITKVFYNCHRKTVPVITRYHRSGINLPIAEDNRKIKAGLRARQESMEQDDEEITMQQFLDGFIKIFQQNNYSDFVDGAVQDRKNLFKISNFPSETFLREITSSAQRKGKLIKSITSLQVISGLLDIQKQIFKNVMELNQNQEIHNEDLDYFRYKLAYSELFYRSVFTTLRSKKEGMMTIHNFNLFRTLIEQTLSSIINTQTCSHQLLYIPNIPILNYFVNPALCVIKNFIIKEQSYSKSQSSSNYEDFEREIPKIAFINLDGVESPVNLQFLRTSISNSILYVTIYKEYEDSNESSNEIGLFYSRFLARLILDCNTQTSKTAQKNEQYNIFRPSKILAFPLNSPFIKSQNPTASCSLQGTSSDILFLFESCIYEQLRLFSPNIIFISYGGKLVIQQSEFNEIIRKLTVISDHKIILFANLCSLFTPKNHLHEAMQLSQKQKQEKHQQSMEMGQQINDRDGNNNEFNFSAEIQDLENVAQFLQDYLIGDSQLMQNMGFDVELFFNNLAMFNKIVSGAYSFEQKREVKPSDKFSVGKRYQYLEALSKIKKFAYLGKYCSKNANGMALQKLLSIQRDAFLNMNKQQSNFFSHFIDKAIQILLNREAELPAALKYKFQRLQLSLQFNQKQLSEYFKERKKNLLVQSISRPKTQKFFTLPHGGSSELKHRDIMCLQFYLVDNFALGNRQRILLDAFTQVLIDRKTGIIFCLNYLDCRFYMCWLYGKINQNKKYVELRVLKKINSSEQKLFYFEFSYLFSDSGSRLYLYWPSQWNCLQQAARSLLNLQYNPPKCHRVLIIQYNKLQLHSKIPSIIELAPASQQMAIPRQGSTMYEKSISQLYIFGGFYMNLPGCGIKAQALGTGVTVMAIDYNKNQFILEDISKSVLRCRLRPKAGYSVKPIDNGRKVIIEGGYGKQFTNYYNIYSYIRYTFNLSTHELTSEKTHRYINSLQSPLHSPTIHESPNPSPSKSLQRQSSQSPTIKSPTLSPYLRTNLKYKFLLATNTDSPLSFINDEYMVNTHREQARTGIFQMQSQIRSIGGSILNSPQFYLTQSNNSINKSNRHRLTRVQIVAPTSFLPSSQNAELIMKDWMMPCQDSIISMCFDACEGALYMLACQIAQNENVGIYKAEISNLSQKQVEQNRQQIPTPQHKKSSVNSSIVFHPYYLLTSAITQNKNTNNFDSKTIYKLGCKILIIGGQSNMIQQVDSCCYRREDYLIEELRGVITANKIVCEIDAEKSDINCRNILDCYRPYIVRQPKSLNEVNNSQLFAYYIHHSTSNSYDLAIHHYSLQQKWHRITKSSLTVCLLQTNSLLQIVPILHEPIMTAIHPYKCIQVNSALLDAYNSVHAIMKYIVKRQGQSGYGQEYDVDMQRVSNDIGRIIAAKQSRDISKCQLDQLYERVREFGMYVSSPRSQKYYDYPQLKHAINQLLTLTLSCIIQTVCFKLIEQPQHKQLHRFYLQDSSCPNAKYIAIAELGTNNIIFLRVKFNSRVAIPMPSNSSQHLQNSQVLYCANLVANSLNSVLYCNQDYTKHCRMGTEGQEQGVDIDQITPYDQEVEEFIVNVRMESQYKQQDKTNEANISNLMKINIKQ